MDKKTISIIVGILIVVLCVPLLPKLKEIIDPPRPLTDDERIAQIRQALDEYKTTNGRFPTTLDVLVPTHLASVPQNKAGQNFNYNARTGAVINPTQAASSRNRGGVGVTPMTDAMTGLSVSEELNF